MDKQAFAQIGQIEIEPTTACNRSCWFCAPGLPPGRRAAPRLLDAAVFAALLEELGELNYANYLTFCGWGEPTLHPELDEWILMARRALPGAYLTVLTNGDCGRDRIQRLLDETPIQMVFIDNYEPGRSWDLETDRIHVEEHVGRPARRYHYRAGNFKPWRDERRRVRAARRVPCGQFRGGIFFTAEGRWVTCCNDMAQIHQWPAGVEALFSNEDYLAMRRGLIESPVDREKWRPCCKCGCWGPGSEGKPLRPFAFEAST